MVGVSAAGAGVGETLPLSQSCCCGGCPSQPTGAAHCGLTSTPQQSRQLTFNSAAQIQTLASFLWGTFLYPASSMPATAATGLSRARCVAPGGLAHGNRGAHYQGGGPLTRLRSSGLSAETRRLSARALTPLGGENTKTERVEYRAGYLRSRGRKRRDPNCSLPTVKRRPCGSGEKETTSPTRPRGGWAASTNKRVVGVKQAQPPWPQLLQLPRRGAHCLLRAYCSTRSNLLVCQLRSLRPHSCGTDPAPATETGTTVAGPVAHPPRPALFGSRPHVTDLRAGEMPISPRFQACFRCDTRPVASTQGSACAGGTRHSHDLLEAAQQLCSGEGKRRAGDMTPRS